VSRVRGKSRVPLNFAPSHACSTMLAESAFSSSSAFSARELAVSLHPGLAALAPRHLLRAGVARSGGSDVCAEGAALAAVVAVASHPGFAALAPPGLLSARVGSPWGGDIGASRWRGRRGRRRRGRRGRRRLCRHRRRRRRRRGLLGCWSGRRWRRRRRCRPRVGKSVEDVGRAARDVGDFRAIVLCSQRSPAVLRVPKDVVGTVVPGQPPSAVRVLCHGPDERARVSRSRGLSQQVAKERLPVRSGVRRRGLRSHPVLFFFKFLPPKVAL